MNIFIEGDRSVFLSKSAIDRFKKDVKELDQSKLDAINSSKYLKEGYVFKTLVENNSIKVNIISLEQEKAEAQLKQKEDSRKQLREQLKQLKNTRTGQVHKHLDTLKRTVPENIYKSYHNLIRNFQMPNIPAPDEVINNVDKYRTQIATILGLGGNVSNDARASICIKQYFTALGQFLGIEPIDINKLSETNIPTNQTNVNNDDTEDEDEPELINAD
jgi:hypothetical protein